MTVQSIDLAWIVVANLESAVKFYTDVVGLKLVEKSPEFGWAELQGHDGGAFLGIAQASPQEDHPAGHNAVITLSVANLEATVADFSKKGGRCVGEVLEIPGHVKMQSIVDVDGNKLQLVQKLA